MSSRPSRGAARLAAILDALPDALLLVNCNGTVVNANSIALEVFESPGTALVGRGLLDLLPDFDSKRIPGSMRRPDDVSEGPTKPTRMVARRTDGTKFLVEVTSANLEDGRTPYESSFEAAFADHGNSYTGDELLMLVVRDLTGTLDTEAELARQQRQTEMILRAAAEGVVGVDVEGRIVLVNPSAAQLLGYRASDLGGRKLHPLVHHSRADGSPLPYEETPVADTLRSGRKHRVRGQVLWTKDGRAIPVDLTTAPVRDGDQLVGAVLAFTDRTAYDALLARHQQLLSVLESGLRGPLEQLRGELAGLASDPAGQLWPEANQILHHLVAGYARMTTLVDNVLSYQRLDAGGEKLKRESVSLDEVISAGVEGAVELIGPGRAQFAVHAPPIDVEVDPVRLAQALAHLVADVAGVDTAGAVPGPTASGDPTIVVAAAQRGDVVRIEVRGPYGGGSPVHEPLVRGIVRRHGGVLQTHQVPGAGGGSAYVLEVPVGSPKPTGNKAKGASEGASGAESEDASGAPGAAEPAQSPQMPQPSQGGGETTVMPVPARPVRGMPAADAVGTPGAGTSGTAGTDGGGAVALPASAPAGTPAPPSEPAVPDDGGGATPPPAGTGRRRARRTLAQVEDRAEGGTGSGEHAMPQPAADGTAGHPVPPHQIPHQVQPGTGLRARPTAVPEPSPVPAQAQTPERAAFAMPPAAGPADHTTPPQQHAQQPQVQGQPPFPEPEAAVSQADRPTGRRRRPSVQEGPQPAPAEQEGPRPESPSPQEPVEHDHSNGAEQLRRSAHPVVAASPILGGDVPPAAAPRPRTPPMPGSETAAEHSSGVSVRTLGQGVLPYGQQPGDQHTGQQPGDQHTGQHPVQHTGQHPVPHPAQHSGEHAVQHPVQSTGQHAMQRAAVPAPAQVPAPAPAPAPAAPSGAGRRRKLAAPPEEGERAAAAAGATPLAVPPHAQLQPPAPPQPQPPVPPQQSTPPHPHPSPVVPP
ncbi:MAG TPA: PAS domain-containing protein, partial [Streptomyces sp.]|nr:PAS domain-containing protein [Streptomyces sp.]